MAGWNRHTRRSSDGKISHCYWKTPDMDISDMNTVCAKTPSNQIIQSHLPTFIWWWNLPLLHWNVFSWEKYEKVVNGYHALKDFGKYFFLYWKPSNPGGKEYSCKHIYLNRHRLQHQTFLNITCYRYTWECKCLIRNKVSSTSLSLCWPCDGLGWCFLYVKFTFSFCACMGSLQVFWFCPRLQRQACFCSPTA